MCYALDMTNENETKFNQIFAFNLRKYLAENEMSQVALAQKLNVGTTSVYNWCNGIKIPRMDKVDSMCKIFGCKRSDLIIDHNQAAPTDDASSEEKEFIELFQAADPGIRNSVMILLKSSKQDS